MRIAASAGMLALAGLLLDERLVGLDGLSFAADLWRTLGRGHGFADTVSHEPRGFVGDPKHAMELVGGNAFLARSHEVDRQKPFVDRDMRPLENRARPDREFALAAVAGEHPGLCLAAHLVDVVGLAKGA